MPFSDTHSGAASALRRAQDRWGADVAVQSTGGAADHGFGGTHDRELVRRAALSEVRAFEALYDRHGASALALSRHMLRDRAAAEDATQEAFVSVWRGCDGYRPERGSVRTWILVIVRNRCVDALRRTSVDDGRGVGGESLAKPLEAPARTDAEVTRRGQARELRAALEAVPAEQRHAIELAYFRGLSPTEIASRLEPPAMAVNERPMAGGDDLHE